MQDHEQAVREARRRLQQKRIALGLSEDELAKRMGISSERYYDLEADDSELAVCFSLHEVQKICHVLGLSLEYLLLGRGGQHSTQQQGFDFRSLAGQLDVFLKERPMSLPDFETESGWNLAGFLENPERGGNWNLDCLRDVCGVMKVDWSGFISRG